MIIRKAMPKDVNDLKTLYFEHLTHWPPKEEQNMHSWHTLIEKFAKNENIHLLVVEVEGKIVSTIQLVIIENLTHNLRPFAVVENVVTHSGYRNKGYASSLLNEATKIAKERNCYKIFLETGSNREEILNFYRNNGFEIDSKHSCLKRL